MIAALEQARKGFLRLAVTAPLRRGGVDRMLTGAARAVEDLAATLDAGNDADELAEQVARVRQVAELWAGVVSALASLGAAPLVLCAPCAVAQVAEPVVLPAVEPDGCCARCGTEPSAPEPTAVECPICSAPAGQACVKGDGRGGLVVREAHSARHRAAEQASKPLPLPPAHALYAAERKALDDLCRWTEKRYGEDATVRDYQAAERKLAEAGGELIDARARAAEEPAS